ncbi:MAG: hypothetical protein ABSC50_03020 [Candidatus Bathyarchaeia archaeon]
MTLSIAEVAKRVDFTRIDFTGKFNVVDTAIAEPKAQLRPSQPSIPNISFHTSSSCRDPRGLLELVEPCQVLADFLFSANTYIK